MTPLPIVFSGFLAGLVAAAAVGGSASLLAALAFFFVGLMSLWRPGRGMLALSGVFLGWLSLPPPGPTLPEETALFACRPSQIAAGPTGGLQVACEWIAVRRGPTWRRLGPGRLFSASWQAPIPDTASLLIGRGRAWRRGARDGLGVFARGRWVEVRRPGSRFETWSWGLRRRSEEVLSRVHGPGGLVLWAMILGRHGPSFQGVRATFARLGLAHILVVSGLHLGLLAALLFWGLTRLIGAWPALAERLAAPRAAAWVTIPVIWSYLLILAPSAASLRAAVMVTCLLAGVLWDRPSQAAASLAFAGLLLLLWRPGWVYAPGFQLSFLATGVLIVVVPRRPHGLAGWVRSSLWASAAVSLATWPFAAHHFGRVPWLAPLINLVAVPWFCWIVLPLGLFGLLWGLWWPHGTIWPLVLSAKLADLGVLVLTRVSAWWTALPWRPTWPEVAVFAAPWILAGLGIRFRRRSRRVVLIAASVWSLAVLGHGVVSEMERPELVTLSRGCGQALAVSLPGRRAVVVDGGCGGDARRLFRELQRRWVRCVDLAVVTHCHRDHAEGILWLLEHGCVHRVWMARPGACPLGRRIRSVARRKGIPLDTGPSLRIGRARIQRIWPQTDRWDPMLDDNEDSMVVRLSMGRVSVLFPGDVGTSTQRRMSIQSRLLRSTVLVAPHHGSALSFFPEFFEKVHPALLLVVGSTPRTDFALMHEYAPRIVRARGSGLLGIDLSRRTLPMRRWR